MNQLAVRTPSQLAVRSGLDKLQVSLTTEIAKGTIEQTISDCKQDNSQATHYYGENIYARSLVIPAGTCVLGYIHKQDRVCVIASGTGVFVDEFHGRVEYAAPYIAEFKAGTKTAVYAHTETTWVACLGTDSTDEDNITNKLVCGTHEEYLDYINVLRNTGEAA